MPFCYDLQKKISRYVRFAAVSVSAILLMTTGANAQELSESVQAALVNHPSIGAAHANEAAVKSQKDEAVADYFPDININAAGGRIYGNNSTSRGSVTTRGSAYSNLWEGGVTLTQPIFSGFETWNRSKAASHDMDAARYNLLDVEGSLAFRTTVAYLDVLRAYELSQEVEMFDERLAEYISRIQALVEEGAADQSILTRAVDLRAEVKNTSADIRSSLRVAKAEYQEVVGAEAKPENMKLPYPQLEYVPVDLDEAISHAKKYHPFLKSFEYQKESLHDTAEAEKQFYYPDITGELSYFEREQVEEIGGEMQDARALLRLNWDISVGARNSARYMQSKQRHLEAKAQWMDSLRQVERQLRVAYSDMIKTQEQLDIQNERLSIAQELYTNYKQQFEGARIDIFQVLQSDNDLYSTKLSVLNSKYALIVTQYGVLASMGRLQEALGVQGTDYQEE